MLLALQPHHDGSAFYVPNQRPNLNDAVSVRVRIHHSIGQVTKVSARQSENGEAFFSKRAKPTPSGDGWSWWEMTINMVNPQVRYRFLIETAEGENFWLNTQGVTQIEPPDALDFRINIHSDAPIWAPNSVMYQIFPDRFARSSAADNRQSPDWAIPKKWSDPVSSSGPDVGREFFGGDLDGITEHLDHLESLGVTVLYLTPIFPARSNHRYDASSFDVVDPLLGGDEALVRLVQAAHARGMKVMGDLTSNHSGSAHEWFQAAFNNPSAIESDFYYFSEDNSKYECWWGVDTLPKFNWKSLELRKRFIDGPDSVVAKWLRAPFHLDGWRIDVANMTGRFEDEDLYLDVAKTIKRTMQEINDETLLLGEYTSDAQDHFSGDGYHGAMTYFNFTKPLWRWFANDQIGIHPAFPGPGQPRYNGEQFYEAHRQFIAGFPWHVRQNNMNALDTHDIPRFKTVSILGGQLVGAGLQFSLPGIPVIFAGDEFGLEGNNGEHSRTPIPWNDERENDRSMIEVYSKLAKIRRENATLVSGSVRWLYSSKEAIVFVREDEAATILICATRYGDPNIKLPMDSLTDIEQAKNLFGNGSITVAGSWLMLPSQPLGVNIWRLPPPRG
ncbi:MAG: glycoside hydrolase family 13 protein [Actinomycetota bacterium]